MYLVNLYNNEIECTVYTTDMPLQALTLTTYLNQAKELYFEIESTNKGYNFIDNIKTKIKVIDLNINKIIFSGRVVNSIPRINSSGKQYKEVICIEALSYLNDIHSSIWSYINLYPEEIIYNLLAEYNRKVENEKKIYLGKVEIKEKTSIITNKKGILDELMQLPIILGGVFSIRDENNKFYLDYLAEYNQEGDLSFTFGEEIVSFIKQFDTKEIATRIIPINYRDGTKVNVNDIKNLKYVEQIGKITADTEINYEAFKHVFRVRVINNYIDYIEDETASENYGIIEKVWSHPNISVPSSLIQSTKIYLNQINQPNFSIDVDENTLKTIVQYVDDSFSIGNIIHIRNDNLKINVRPIIIKTVLDLLKVYNPIHTISTRQPLFFETNSSEDLEELKNKLSGTFDLSHIEEEISKNGDLIKVVTDKIEETSSYIEEHKDSIEMGITSEVLEETVTTINGEISEVNKKISDTNTYLGLYKEHIEMGVTSNELSTTKTELERRIDNVNVSATYKVDIIPIGGDRFMPGDEVITLIARVYRGSEDVTDSIDINRFRWTRKSDDEASDTIWNQNHFSGAKQINVYNDDVFIKAVFYCEILDQ